MYVRETLFQKLNLNLCFLHTKTYTCRIIITSKVYSDIILMILTKAMDISYLKCWHFQNSSEVLLNIIILKNFIK